MSLYMLESMAIALFVMKKMRKQKTCVNSDRKNIMFINFRFWCKVTETGWTSSRMGGQTLLHSRSSMTMNVSNYPSEMSVYLQPMYEGKKK
jgi:hypothetical protein